MPRTHTPLSLALHPPDDGVPRHLITPIASLHVAHSAPLPLLKPLQVSQFQLHLSHVGALQRLTLATDASAWLCDQVVVHDARLQETVYFLCGR